MKRYFYVLGLLPILALLVLCWWFFTNKTSVSVAAASPSASTVTHAQFPSSTSSSSALTATSSAPAASGSIPEYAKERWKKTLAVLESENRKSLDMHGKVIDQYGQPVVGAQVRGSILLNKGVTRSKDDIHYTETDAQGLFSFIGVHGVTMGIWPQKEGYYYDLRLNTLRKENYHGSHENPDVFVMWKLKGAEHLIRDDKFYGIQPDGRVYTIDLIKGTKREGAFPDGDLLVRIQRTSELSPTSKCEWSCSVQVIQGGLIEATTLYLNEAPEGEYQNQYSVSNSDGSQEFNKTFYLKTRSGHAHGWIKIQVIPNYNDIAIFKFQSLVNPSGSRNLEVDPQKVTDANPQ